MYISNTDTKIFLLPILLLYFPSFKFWYFYHCCYSLYCIYVIYSINHQHWPDLTSCLMIIMFIIFFCTVFLLPLTLIIIFQFGSSVGVPVWSVLCLKQENSSLKVDPHCCRFDSSFQSKSRFIFSNKTASSQRAQQRQKEKTRRGARRSSWGMYECLIWTDISIKRLGWAPFAGSTTQMFNTTGSSSDVWAFIFNYCHQTSFIFHFVHFLVSVSCFEISWHILYSCLCIPAKPAEYIL